MVAEAAHGPDRRCLKHIDNQQLLSQVYCALCPVAHTMNYIASAFSPAPTSAKSVESGFSTPSILEEPVLGEADSDVAFKRRSVSSRTRTRTKTAFLLCHPPPVHIHKQRLHIRPRVLLQLQKVSKASRPTPIFEVLPSVVFAPRLARHFPRTFKGKAGLGVDDLVIVSSENYEAQETDAHDIDDLFDDKWDKREIIAAICQPSKDDYPYGHGETEICINHGQSWTASQRKNGTYEFTSTDDGGNRTVARWVPKQLKGDRTASITSTSDEKKFNFSMLNPNSRRHAIIATLDRQTIEVSDQYSHPSTSLSSQTSSTPTTSSSLGSEEPETPSIGSSVTARDPIEVDDALRTLITITGIWIAFREGFSSNFKYGEPTQGLSTSPNLASGHKHRSLSLNANQFNSNQFAIPKSPSHSLGSLKRTRAGLQHSVSNSIVPLSSYPPFTPPPRSISTGTAFMQRLSTRKSSTPTAIQLSSLGDFEGSDTEKDASLANGSPLPRSSMGSRDGRNVSLERGVAGLGLDLGESVSQSTERVTKRSSRIGKMFGRSPKERDV
ncbi:MAG: hypothetical protein ALECFALPRED_007787 [Alectoria fallacina]|uniref:Uncharacterized protein n=1 Tax=Alectoria fallacina TaxID=1903189 RepID=A0A8H3I929_9LECA|nr:MAG: hypothetical protein ALECFALPRED_007787 [Alectoria fallacina]